MAYSTYAEYLKGMKKGGRGKQAMGQAAWTKRKNPGPTDPITEKQINTRADAAAADAIAPGLSAVDTARDRQTRRYDAQVKAEREGGLAFAQQLQSIAPRVYGNYEKSAGALSGIAKGFGEGAENAASAQADSWEALLNQAGQSASSGVMRDATAGLGGIGDSIFGEAGYIPSQDMLREGASWGALAEMQPAYEVGRSGQRVSQFGAENLGKQRDLDDEESKIRGTYGAERRTALADLRENELGKFSAREAARELNADIRSSDKDRKLKEAEMVADAVTKGLVLDVPASQARGFAVYQDGHTDSSIKIDKRLPQGNQDDKPGAKKAKAKTAAADLAADVWELGAEQTELDDLTQEKIVTQPEWQFWKYKQELHARVYDVLKASGMTDPQINTWIEATLRRKGIRRKAK